MISIALLLNTCNKNRDLGTSLFHSTNWSCFHQTQRHPSPCLSCPPVIMVHHFMSFPWQRPWDQLQTLHIPGGSSLKRTGKDCYKPEGSEQQSKSVFCIWLDHCTHELVAPVSATEDLVNIQSGSIPEWSKKGLTSSHLAEALGSWESVFFKCVAPSKSTPLQEMAP